MTPTELAASIHSHLLAAHDPAFAEGQRRFFQHEVDTYGVRAPQVRDLARDVCREIKSWPVPRRDALMKLLWERRKIETGALVCYIYKRFSSTCAAREFDLFERWLDRYVDNWGACDGVSSWLLAACIQNKPDLRLRLPAWTTSKNRWKRRASAVALLQEAKAGRHTEFIFDIASRLLPDRDDMVEKGAGWLLKETYPKRPRETVAFLTAHAKIASRLTLRYAAEKMPPAHRAQVLGR